MITSANDKARSDHSLAAERARLVSQQRPVALAFRSDRIAQIEAELIERGWHHCPAPSCKQLTAREMFCCGFHWRTLPMWIQRSINGAWRQYQLDPLGRADDLIRAHNHARDHWGNR